jgi:cell division protein ZipA
MDQLRLILIILGVVLIVGIYLWGTWGRRRARAARRGLDALDEPFLDRTELPRSGLDGETVDIAFERLDEVAQRSAADAEPPEVDEVVEADAPEVAPRAEPEVAASTQRPGMQRAEAIGARLGRAPGPPIYSGHELIVALTVMARPGRRITGEEMRRALEREDFRFGELSVFHHYGAGAERTVRPVCSIANVLKPGTFDVGELEDFSTPGLSLFMQVPGELEPRAAFETMLGVGRRLAERLDALLCDEARNILTPQAVNHLRERVADYERRQMLRVH